MKFTFTMAKAMVVFALIPAWIPTVMGWGPIDTRSIVCWALFVAIAFTPIIYHDYGPGLKLS